MKGSFLVDVILSTLAVDRIQVKGGKVAVDFIKPVGCGKVSELSVSTNLKGRDLSRYRSVFQDGVSILLSPDLFTHVTAVKLGVRKGIVGSKLIVSADESYVSGCDA